jgi:hypothetical protein
VPPKYFLSHWIYHTRSLINCWLAICQNGMYTWQIWPEFKMSVGLVYTSFWTYQARSFVLELFWKSSCFFGPWYTHPQMLCILSKTCVSPKLANVFFQRWFQTLKIFIYCTWFEKDYMNVGINVGTINFGGSQHKLVVLEVSVLL